jgi:hypothetical protein
MNFPLGKIKGVLFFDPLLHRNSKTGLSILSSVRKGAEITLKKTKPRSVGKTEADTIKIYFEEAKKRKAQGLSTVKTKKNEHGQPVFTIGFYEITGRTGRGITPDAKGMLDGDDRGHGFPQFGLSDPSEADKVIHMTAENWTLNQGATRVIEDHGRDVFTKHGGLVAKSRQYAYSSSTDQRPNGYHETIYRMDQNGKLHIEVSVVMLNQPLDRYGRLLPGMKPVVPSDLKFN